MDRIATRAVLAVLVAVISLPLSTQALERSKDPERDVASIQNEALHYRTAKWPLIRRAYSDAVAEYRRKVAAGDENAAMPDIGDLSTFRKYLDNYGIDADVEMANRTVRKTKATDQKVRGLIDFTAEDTVAPRRYEVDERVLLRQYMRAGFCPKSLQEMYEGIYEMCVSLIGSRNANSPTGLANDLQEARARLRTPRTLKERLKQLEQARDRSNRREDGNGPPRPTPYMGEPQ